MAPMTMDLARRWRQIRWMDLIWPLLGCAIGWRAIVLNFDAPVLFDPQHTYLPAARAFLAQGWSFLLTKNYSTPPLGYLWPALWGADPSWIRIGNMGLWAGCAWFLWRTGCLLGGQRAGAIAMLLLLLGDLPRYFPSEMTEPVYLLGVFGLIHAMARLVIGRDRTWGAVLQGAVMLSITLLSRPILQLIAPAAWLACLAALGWLRAGGRKDAPGHWSESLPPIALSLGLGLVLPLALMVKNGLVFGLWGLGTGSGVALYLGTHPLSQGAEPIFLGFRYDINDVLNIAVHPDREPLMLAGDRMERAVALWRLQTMPAGEMATFFGRKLWWWLAQHPAELPPPRGPGNILRQLRLFELWTTAVATLWAVLGWRRLRRPAAARSYATALASAPTPRQWAFAAVLLGMFTLVTIQLLPLLYNSRYSIYLLDPWLLPLTAFGLACITGGIGKNRWHMAAPQGKAVLAALASLAAILALTSLSYNLARRWERVGVDPEHMGAVAALFSIADEARIHTIGMTRQGQRQWTITQSPAAFTVGLDQAEVERIRKIAPANAVWDTEIALHSSGPRPLRCQDAELAWQTAAGAILQPAYKLPLRLPLQVDGQFRHLATAANFELRPGDAGGLRILLHCPAGALVEWRQTRFLASRYGQDAAAHIKP